MLQVKSDNLRTTGNEEKRCLGNFGLVDKTFSFSQLSFYCLLFSC